MGILDVLRGTYTQSTFQEVRPPWGEVQPGTFLSLFFLSTLHPVLHRSLASGPGNGPMILRNIARNPLFMGFPGQDMGYEGNTPHGFGTIRDHFLEPLEASYQTGLSRMRCDIMCLQAYM